MQPLNTFLWFDGQAQQAVAFYLSAFAGARAGKVLRWGDVGPPGKRARSWPSTPRSTASA